MWWRRFPAWLLFFAGAHVLLLLYYVTPAGQAGSLYRVAVYCAISLSAALCVFLGVRANKPADRGPWLLLGTGQVLYGLADATFFVSHHLIGVTTYPSVADVLYLAHYPLAAAGVAFMVRLRDGGISVAGVLDASVVAVVAGMAYWFYIVGPRLQNETAPFSQSASLLMVVMDLVLLLTTVRLSFGIRGRQVSHWLLTTSLLIIIAADTVYTLRQLDDTYQAGQGLDAVWLSGNIGIAAAALHPSMVALTKSAANAGSGLRPGRITALTAAALVVPMMMLTRPGTDITALALGSALLSLLVVARLTGLAKAQHRLAVTDALTGLHTRRFFESNLKLEAARARRDSDVLAMVIADVDRFKSINDNYGHPAGDQVLREVAHRLRGACRRGDLLARYGGEEFALLVRGANQHTLCAVAERLRQEVNRDPVVLSDGTLVLVTVSVGAATLPTDGVGTNCANVTDDMVLEADNALYAAKAAGRNRVVIAGDTIPAPRADTEAVMIEVLFQVADRVDGWLGRADHSRTVSRWAAALARAAGLDTVTVDRVGNAGRLHDIGKVIIPEVLLTKPGSLSSAERLRMRQHPEHGYQLARAMPGGEGMAQCIRQQRERYDGTGHPRGLRGTEIRVEARIMAICAAWASMRADRPGRRALSRDAARSELWDGRGTQFDPDLVLLFLDLEEERAAEGRTGSPRWSSSSRFDGSSLFG